MKEIKDQYKQTLLINLLDLWHRTEQARGSYLYGKRKSNSLGRFGYTINRDTTSFMCPCVFNIGSAADVENRSGRLVKFKCLYY